MTIAFDIRRSAVFGLALLLFMAVIGPACLLSASQAMGMPMGPMPAPMDCDTDGNETVGACPHASSAKIVGDVARTNAPAVDVALVTPEPLLAPVVGTRMIPRAERLSSPPPSHLTPLRL